MAEVTDVKGVGPATAIKLKKAGIDKAEDLAQAKLENLIEAGIRETTAKKIVNAAIEMVGDVKDKTLTDLKDDAVSQIADLKARKTTKKAKKKAVKPAKQKLTVKGVGPKNQKVLAEGGIESNQQLADASIEQVTGLGIAPKTAVKFINSAREELGISELVSFEEEVESLPKEKPSKKKAKKKTSKPKKETPASPMPQGIPTKKKRGQQIRRITDVDESASVEEVDKGEGWVVQARELSKEEIERKKKRAEEMAMARKITRPIPQAPEPVKATKTKDAKTSPRPLKIEKAAKTVKKAKKKKKQVVEYYNPDILQPYTESSRKRGTSSKAGTKKARIELSRDTYLGRISSHRRSRRVVHNTQVIVELENGYNPDQIVGQKIYFTYPDNDLKVAGSIAKRFGKATSGKVLAYFKKGIRLEGIHQKVFIK